MAKTTITTIEDLAQMINEGFKTTASKEDSKEVTQDMTAVRSEMKVGFGRIENLLIEEQRRKIENLETRMKTLEDALAV
jgi:flagellar basal body P-ring protein FlgI